MKSYNRDPKIYPNFTGVMEYMLRFSKIVMLIFGIVVAVLCVTILF